MRRDRGVLRISRGLGGQRVHPPACRARPGSGPARRRAGRSGQRRTGGARPDGGHGAGDRVAARLATGGRPIGRPTAGSDAAVSGDGRRRAASGISERQPTPMRTVAVRNGSTPMVEAARAPASSGPTEMPASNEKLKIPNARPRSGAGAAMPTIPAAAGKRSPNPIPYRTMATESVSDRPAKAQDGRRHRQERRGRRATRPSTPRRSTRRAMGLSMSTTATSAKMLNRPPWAPVA